MIYTPLTRKAMRLCYEAHAGQLDKSGVPYVCHPLHVAESMPDELSCAVALLHDVVEDTPVTLEQLREAGFPEEVVQAVRLLTRDSGMDYPAYIRRLKPNRLARTVKLADLKHNSDTSRLDVVDERALKRLASYSVAIRELTLAAQEDAP